MAVAQTFKGYVYAYMCIVVRSLRASLRNRTLLSRGNDKCRRGKGENPQQKHEA